MSEQSNSKRLAKNTILMYFRMGFLMLISLYTSRVILQQLGVEDYGIYNVVGSVVVMFISLKSIFASSTQRFLSYEMGKGNYDKLQLIYTMSTAINAIISVVFFILVEAVGLWFIEYKINLDPSRIVAAHWVFQFSVISTILSIMSTPLDACVIAHERMDFYAYLSIFEGLAKLGICYLLSIFDVDKLVLYGFLTLLIAIVVRIINQVFCMSQFTECHLMKCWDKQYFVKMTSFAGWAFFGNTANALSMSGLNMVLNVFGGPVVNAARGIAYQVQSALSQFVSNLTIVVKPYAIKTYASGDTEKAVNFAHISSKIYFTVQMLLVVFVTYLADSLLKMWLGEVPLYTAGFLILVMVQSLVRSLHMPLDFLFCAEGDIKFYQIIEGVVLALPVPVGYLLLHCGLSFYSVFWGVIVCEVFHIAAISILAVYKCHLNMKNYLKQVILPCLIASVIYGILYYMNYQYIQNGYLKIANVLVSCTVITGFMAFFAFNKSERELILHVIKRK